MTRTQIAAAVPLAVTLMTGCGGERRSGGGADPATDLATAVQWSVEPELHIGSVDDPDLMLSEVGEVVIGPQGKLYVSQRGEGSIRVFNVDGRLSEIIGGRGQGPGEFASVSAISLKADTLVAADDGLGRVSLFSLDGQLLRTVSWKTERRPGPRWEPYHASVSYPSTAPRILLADGTALTHVTTVPIATGASDRVEGVWSLGPWENPFLHIDHDGIALDTLARDSQTVSFLTIGSGNSRAFVVMGTYELPAVGLMRDGSGVVVVNQVDAVKDGHAGIVVTLIGPSGDLVYADSFAYVPVPTTEEAVEQTAWQMYEGIPGRPDATAIASALRESGLVPDHLVPVTAVTTGQDGSVWLRREKVAGDSATWNVVRGTGGPLGAVRLPAGDSLINAHNDILVTVSHDELDVPYVTRYRIRR